MDVEALSTQEMYTWLLEPGVGSVGGGVGAVGAIAIAPQSPTVMTVTQQALFIRLPYTHKLTPLQQDTITIVEAN